MSKHGQLPFTEPEWKVPGYTGFVQGLQETYKKTPIMAQLETKQPPEESFIHTRTCSLPKSTIQSMQRDPCNFEENFKKPEVDNLWPRLQEKAAQESFKPPCSNIALGDERVSPFTTSYSTDFYAPFNAHERLRSPMRNKDLAAGGGHNLREHYASSYNRVGEKRLAKMISTMRERLSAKLGNNNDNAFKMRKLFKMYDRKEVGMIHFEDFRMFTESFGMQLDDDSLLALYHVYDPTGSGYLAYEEIVKQLLDKDYYAMYSPAGVDNTQALVDAQNTQVLVANLRTRINGSVEDMRTVFASLDTAGSGLLPQKGFQAGCAALGVVLSAKEQAWVQQAAMTADGSRMVNWGVFCDAFRD